MDHILFLHHQLMDIWIVSSFWWLWIWWVNIRTQGFRWMYSTFVSGIAALLFVLTQAFGYEKILFSFERSCWGWGAYGFDLCMCLSRVVCQRWVTSLCWGQLWAWRRKNGLLVGVFLSNLGPISWLKFQVTIQLSAYFKKTGESHHRLVLWYFFVLYFSLEKEINARARETTTQKSLENVFGQSMLKTGLI